MVPLRSYSNQSSFLTNVVEHSQQAAVSKDVDLNLRILEGACSELGYCPLAIDHIKTCFKGIQFHKELGRGSQSIVFLVTLAGNKDMLTLKLCKNLPDPYFRTTGYSEQREGGGDA